MAPGKRHVGLTQPMNLQLLCPDLVVRPRKGRHMGNVVESTAAQGDNLFALDPCRQLSRLFQVKHSADQ